MRRIALIAVLALMAVSIAPAAIAHDCYRCRFIPPNLYTCVVVTDHRMASWEFCEMDGDMCYVSNPCSPHEQARLTPLTSEYTVASVEPLENELLLAEAEINPTALR